jgi:hypothetical protein
MSPESIAGFENDSKVSIPLSVVAGEIGFAIQGIAIIIIVLKPRK